MTGTDASKDAVRSSSADALRARLNQGPPVVLDGPTGTMLEDMGVDTSGPLWSAEALVHDRAKVVTLHADYARAGAEVLTAVTFRTHPSLFEGRGGRLAWERTLQAGVHAVEEGFVLAGVPREGRWIAGSMAPVGESYRPKGVPADDVLEREHLFQASGLMEAGVDLLLVETMVLEREARIAVRSAKATSLPVWVSFVVGPDARLLSGESLEQEIGAVVDEGADAVLVNCSSLENTRGALEVLRGAPVPWGVYPNGSTGDPERGWGPRVSVEEFQEVAMDWVRRGARVIGSCCATGPAHTEALVRLATKRTSR